MKMHCIICVQKFKFMYIPVVNAVHKLSPNYFLLIPPAPFVSYYIKMLQ